MQVDKLELGTVVDHIPSGQAAKIMRLLKISPSYPHRVAVVLNVPSKKMGTKDILKIEGKMIDQELVNVIALVSPQATVNVIQGGKVVKKFSLKLPDKIHSLGKCPNINCISSEVKSFFVLESKNRYRCHYCERLFEASSIF